MNTRSHQQTVKISIHSVFRQRTSDNNGAMGITGFCETRLCVCLCVSQPLDMSLRGSFWYEIRQCLISGTPLVHCLSFTGGCCELLHLQKSQFTVIAIAKNLQCDFGGPSKFGGPRLQPFRLMANPALVLMTSFPVRCPSNT